MDRDVKHVKIREKKERITVIDIKYEREDESEHNPKFRKTDSWEHSGTTALLVLLKALASEVAALLDLPESLDVRDIAWKYDSNFIEFVAISGCYQNAAGVHTYKAADQIVRMLSKYQQLLLSQIKSAALVMVDNDTRAQSAQLEFFYDDDSDADTDTEVDTDAVSATISAEHPVSEPEDEDDAVRELVAE